MSFFGKWFPALSAVVLLAGVAGCSQMDQGGPDDEKEPHYVLGKSRVNAMNYQGAIEAFEESLEANPHSALAHYQLAILYDNQDSVADPAAAIYHYQQCLKFDPKFPNADAIAGRIEACKQRLAENVLQLPSTPAAQQQLEKLVDENRRLHDQLAQWQAYYAAQQAAARTNPPTPPAAVAQQPAPQPSPGSSQTPEDVTTIPTPQPTARTGAGAGPGGAGSSTAGNRRPADTSRSARSRTHTVARGETMAAIARDHGISLNALEEANPHVNPRKLKAGQTLNLPAP